MEISTEPDPVYELIRDNNKPKTTTKGKESDERKPVETKLRQISGLPSVEDIIDVIRKEGGKKGIHIKQLTAKFADRLDETNTKIFIRILDIFDEKGDKWVRLPENPPPQSLVDEIIEKAKVPPTNATSRARLRDPIQITYGGRDETIRKYSRILPQKLYRVYYEDSATLCAYTPRHNHTRNPEKPEARIKSENAFQSIEVFDPKGDLNRDRIERHLVWNRRYPPTSYISAFNNKSDALRRCDFLYHRSTKMARRVSMAVLNTSDLKPITFRATLEGFYTSSRQVDIPAWMSKEALQKYGDKEKKVMTLEGLKESGAEPWFSITELRMCNLDVPAARGHHYEFLAGGRIPLSRVEDIWPYDGDELHESKEGKEIRSVMSIQTWMFNKVTYIWELIATKKRKLNAKESSQEFRKRLRTLTGDVKEKKNEIGDDDDSESERINQKGHEDEDDEDDDENNEDDENEENDEGEEEGNDDNDGGNSLPENVIQAIQAMEIPQLAVLLSKGLQAQSDEDAEKQQKK